MPPVHVPNLAELLATSDRVAALTGAGISTDSGIPDFRGPEGLWTVDPTAERLTHWPSYRDDRDIRRRSWQWRVRNPALLAQPNASHRALARLATGGRLIGLATQNVDGLDVAAGTPREVVHELHGTMREVECVTCEWRTDMAWAVERVVERGDEDPRCPDCGDITKAATVMFGQALPRRILETAVDAAERCDLYLVVGSSLAVHPAAALPRHAVERGARIVVLNAEQTPLDHLATLVLRDRVGAVLPPAVDAALGTNR